MGATQVGLLKPSDWPAVRHIFDEGIATATSETTTPPRLPRRAPTASHRWVAEVDDPVGEVVGWTALSPVSARECHADVAGKLRLHHQQHRGKGIGKALIIRHQVTAADDVAPWTLQTAIFTENRASIALHHAAVSRQVPCHCAMRSQMPTEW